MKLSEVIGKYEAKLEFPIGKLKISEKMKHDFPGNCVIKDTGVSCYHTPVKNKPLGFLSISYPIY